jgi:uncharacterized protein (DUF2132 family)
MKSIRLLSDAFSISNIKIIKMPEEQPNNPLHGVTLKAILEHLVKVYGWEELGSRIKINSFNFDPSIKSSLTFLRKTPWARDKVEQLYIKSLKNK